MSNCTYSEYLRNINELQKTIDSSPNNPNIKSYLNFILSILSQRQGPSTLDGLLNYDLKEKLISIYYEHQDTIEMINEYIFIKLYFNNEQARNLRKIFVPNCILYENERNPTKSEELYMEINLLQRDFENCENNGMMDQNFTNIFPQKLQNIKNSYSIIINNLDKFDRDFFEVLIHNLDKINEEIKGKEIQMKIISNKNYHNLNLDAVKGIPLHNRTFFYHNEKLIFGEDMFIEYKNYHFPFNNKNREEFKKQICSFLNSKGGRIYIGISDDKVVNGNILNYHDKDKNTNDIVNLTYDFFPKCRKKIDVVFIPIKNKENNYIKNLYVIKIIVSQGDTNTLYSITNRGGFISYLRLKGQCALLTAEEIKNELLTRDKNPEKQIDSKEFIDPAPDIPELIIANDNLSNNKINNLDYQFKKINNINNFNFNQNYLKEDGEEEEDEDEFNNKDGNLAQIRGRGERKGKGKSGRKGERDNRKFYSVKITVTSNLGIFPTIKELKAEFKGINNCRKKFNKKGNNDVYGFLDFFDRNQAIAFLRTFKSNKEFYEIHANAQFDA